MYSTLVILALCNLLYFALHVTGSGSFPRPLSAAEERTYLLRAREGDKEAKNQLIEHNLRLVAHIIKKYYANFKDQDDLISIGTIGLIKAVSTFDCEKGTRFATYASRCIENEILMHFRGRRKFAQDVFMSDPIDTDKDGNALSFQDILTDESNIYDEIDLRIKSEQLHRFIAGALEAREREILYLRYGLQGAQPLTQREVAEKLGISRSYVSGRA
ncbi:MAG: RNA polymerase sporulation sigma factor SigK [Provencibacterium sp.]|jgi:RNA polymerase sporulation-specific sigma factor|nr:RNA polymerase sporulation sigma factor SigK [Provencibacterium sp.]